ncbi:MULTISPECIES: hypothetical protein [Burkholderia]|uniref:hypothetical protein n=1 Tax=Burkholderia TaxID=32008 RepID=UPI0008412B30|nr:MULTISPECIES: hypothetical protein [unclassified Burkholderia]AOK32031.1 hypothetical protein AQ611_21345 [Burkholderia sp. Bp7605]
MSSAFDMRENRLGGVERTSFANVGQVIVLRLIMKRASIFLSVRLFGDEEVYKGCKLAFEIFASMLERMRGFEHSMI